MGGSLCTPRNDDVVEEVSARANGSSSADQATTSNPFVFDHNAEYLFRRL